MSILAIDWGSSNCRLALLDVTDGRVLTQSQLAVGILTHRPAQPAAVLSTQLAAWLTTAERDSIQLVIICGMAASEAGWHYLPHQRCPVGFTEQQAGLQQIPPQKTTGFSAVPVWLTAGVRDERGWVDLMRGEEVQILGSDVTEGWVCLPGTHSKWVWLAQGQIRHFQSWLTGELYQQSLQLPALQSFIAATSDMHHFCPDSFSAGLQLAEQQCSLSRLWFAARSRLLADHAQLHAPSLLSGLLIGDELQPLRRQQPTDAGSAWPHRRTAQPVTLIASGVLAQRYQLALQHYQIAVTQVDANQAGWRGLWRLASTVLPAS